MARNDSLIPDTVNLWEFDQQMEKLALVGSFSFDSHIPKTSRSIKIIISLPADLPLLAGEFYRNDCTLTVSPGMTSKLVMIPNWAFIVRHRVQTWQILPEPMLPGSNLTGLTRANDYWIAHTDKKLGTQYLHEDLSGFNIIDCYQSLFRQTRLHEYGVRYSRLLRRPVRFFQVLAALCTLSIITKERTYSRLYYMFLFHVRLLH